MKGNNYFLNEENDNCERLSTFCANKFIHVKVIKTNTECSTENAALKWLMMEIAIHFNEIFIPFIDGLGGRC